MNDMVYRNIFRGGICFVLASFCLWFFIEEYYLLIDSYFMALSVIFYLIGFDTFVPLKNIYSIDIGKGMSIPFPRQCVVCSSKIDLRTWHLTASRMDFSTNTNIIGLNVILCERCKKASNIFFNFTRALVVVSIIFLVFAAIGPFIIIPGAGDYHQNATVFLAFWSIFLIFVITMIILIILQYAISGPSKAIQKNCGLANGSKYPKLWTRNRDLFEAINSALPKSYRKTTKD